MDLREQGPTQNLSDFVHALPRLWPVVLRGPSRALRCARRPLHHRTASWFTRRTRSTRRDAKTSHTLLRPYVETHGLHDRQRLLHVDDCALEPYAGWIERAHVAATQVAVGEVGPVEVGTR